MTWGRVGHFLLNRERSLSLSLCSVTFLDGVGRSDSVSSDTKLALSKAKELAHAMGAPYFDLKLPRAQEDEETATVQAIFSSLVASVMKNKLERRKCGKFAALEHDQSSRQPEPQGDEASEPSKSGVPVKQQLPQIRVHVLRSLGFLVMIIVLLYLLFSSKTLTRIHRHANPVQTNVDSDPK